MGQSRTDEILDVAEERIRLGGFDSVSFRDIADAIGIKSASVHYHFPKKSDLGRAVVTRYTNRFIAAIGSPDDPAETVTERMKRLSAAYRTALETGGSTCLCTVLGSVPGALPDETAEEVSQFFKRLTAWCAVALADEGNHRISADGIISLLQGSMVLAMATGRRQVMADAEQTLLACLDS